MSVLLWVITWEVGALLALVEFLTGFIQCLGNPSLVFVRIEIGTSCPRGTTAQPKTYSFSFSPL